MIRNLVFLVKDNYVSRKGARMKSDVKIVFFQFFLSGFAALREIIKYSHAILEILDQVVFFGL